MVLNLDKYRSIEWVLEPPQWSRLHSACLLGNFKLVKQIVEEGRDNINRIGKFNKEWYNENPLDVAIRCKHNEIITFLKQHGAKAGWLSPPKRRIRY